MKKLKILAGFLLMSISLFSINDTTVKKLTCVDTLVHIQQQVPFTINLEKQQDMPSFLAYKVPHSVILECRDSLRKLVFHIEENCDTTKPAAQRRLKSARKQIKLLETNYLL